LKTSKKSKKQERDSSLPFFMNIVLITLISQKNLYIHIIIPSYLILLSYFIYFSQATSIVMRCGCNGPFGIQIEGGFTIEREKRNKAEGCHIKMITSYRRRSHLKKKEKKHKDWEEKLQELRKRRKTEI